MKSSIYPKREREREREVSPVRCHNIISFFNSCCGGGGAFKAEQDTKERTMSAEGSVRDHRRRGWDVITEERRRNNDTSDGSTFQTAEGRGRSTFIYEEEEIEGVYDLEMRDPTQIAYGNESSFERLEKMDGKESEKRKGAYSAKSIVPDWEEVTEEEEEKKWEDYLQEGMRYFDEFNSVPKESEYRMKSDEEKRRGYYYEEENIRQKLELNNVMDWIKYKENEQYQIENRIYRQGKKLCEIREIIDGKENQNDLPNCPYQDSFSSDLQREGYWMTEDSLATRTEDVTLFWDPPLINPYDKPEKAETEEEDKDSEEIKLSMNLFPDFQENNYFETTTTTTTTDTTASTATSAAGLDGTAAAGWSVSLGKNLSVDSDGIAIEAFGLKATVGLHPSITFLGQNLLNFLSGPD